MKDGQNQDHIYNLPEGTKEIVIRHGQAENIHEPLSLSIDKATIKAPGLYMQHLSKHNKLVLATALAIITKEEGKISFRSDPYDIFGNQVVGVLELNEKLKNLGINTSKRYTREELVSFLRLNRLLFPDKDKHEALLASVRKFNAEVTQQLAAGNNNRGTKNSDFSQKIEAGDVPFDMTIAVEIFKGMPKKSFIVEICLDATDGSVRFWFESPDLADLIESTREEVLDEERKHFTDAGVTVIDK